MVIPALNTAQRIQTECTTLLDEFDFEGADLKQALRDRERTAVEHDLLNQAP